MTRLRTLLGSYRARLVLGYVLVVVLVAVVWAASLFGPLDAAIHEQQRTALTAVDRGIANVVAAMPVLDESSAKGLVAGTGWRLTVIDAKGDVLVDTVADPATMENHRNRPEVAAALAGRTGSDERLSRTTHVQQLYVAVPATRGGAHVVVRLSEPLRTLNDQVGQARSVGLLALAFALLITGAVAWRLATSATKPVSALADSAHRMAEGDLSGAIPEAPGELGQLSSALTDLRDQMRDRVQGLEAERRNLRAVLDGLTDSMFLIEDGVVTLANDNASAMFKAPFGGWAGRALDDRVMPASLSAVVQGLLLASADDEPRKPLARDVGPDPTGRWFRVTVLPLPRPAQGAAVRRLVMITDTTERMRLDKMRTDFVANASHELKTPTAGILLLAESARTAAADGDGETAMAFLSQIESEADRLRRLVADLLDLSRLETAPQPGSIADVRHTVDLSTMAHGSAARLKGLELSADLGPVAGEDVYVYADPTDVAVALDNLLDNAVAYTDQGGVTVSVSADRSTVAIAVTDTGVGIPAEDLPRVFERFYRVDRSRTRVTGGTGLGLSLVRHIAERSGGSVKISSEVGAGTTVTLELPRA